MAQPNQGSFLKSYAYWSTDAGAIPDAMMRGFNVVVIADVSDMQSYPGCIVMSGLLAHPSLMYMILNTELKDPNFAAVQNQYLSAYYDYLRSPEKEDSIVNILASLYKTNKPILLFVEPDIEQQFYPLEVLVKLMSNEYGVIVANYTNLFVDDPNLQPGFVPDPRFVWRIAELLFTNAYISKEEYSTILPENAIPSSRSVSILLSDYNCVFPTMQAAITAACNIISTYKFQSQTGRICPVINMSAKLDEARQQQVKALVEDSNTRFGKKSVSELSAPHFAGQLPAAK
jgi:hypothetical protein